MRKALVALVALAVLIPVGTYAYIHWVRGDAPERLSLAGDAPPTSTGATAAGTVDGRWKAGAGSQVGYRVKEVLFGQSTEAVGRTDKVTGTMAISGTTVTAVDLTVDMASMSSDESRRDGQFRGRIMDTSRYPTSAFKLAEPLALASIPPDASPIRVSAVGDLTLRGTTKRVTIPLEARRNGHRIEVSGSLHIVFAEWGIPKPDLRAGPHGGQRRVGAPRGVRTGMTDDRGRSVFMAGWGRPGRSDWKAVLVLAFDADEARVLVADAYPDRFPPDHVFPASEATARSVLRGEPDPTISQLYVLR